MILNHSETINSVNRVSKQRLRSETSLLEPDREIGAWIEVDLPNLVIQNAGWEIYRYPGKEAAATELPELLGIKAFLNSGTALADALALGAGEPYPSLILDCVRGIIQVACFFTKELGFASDIAYIKYFEEQFSESCLLYHNPERWDWGDRQYPRREQILFKRITSSTIRKCADGHCDVVAFLRDSHQQLNVFFATDSKGVVQEIDGCFTLHPDVLCMETMKNIYKLVGVQLAGMSKGALGKIVGGVHGCDHLLSLLNKAAQTLDATIKNGDDFTRCSPT